jgi:hypothetical protein
VSECDAQLGGRLAGEVAEYAGECAADLLGELAVAL